MLNIETILDCIRTLQKSKNGVYATDIKRILAVPRGVNIKEQMKSCVVDGLLSSEFVSVGRNLYRLTDKGKNRLRKGKSLIQNPENIMYEVPVEKQKPLFNTLPSALSGLSAVAGVIAENERLERKLLTIRNQLMKLIGVEDNGEATTESDNASSTEESDS